MKPIKSILILLAALLCTGATAEACTSMLVSAKYSATGRPLMWKHRDTGTEHNFIERVPSRDGRFGYVALYNGGDSLLTEAWMGMNDAGFAIMNTASYNLAPDTTEYKDREGLVMSEALARCSSVSDFEHLLVSLPKPMGVQANFGVMDSNGSMAYFETDDYGFKRFDVGDSLIVRTNFSVSGNDTDGMGYIRYQNTLDILAPEISSRSLSPESFTEKASRSFWHSLLERNIEADTCRWAIDRDFIPRRISSASIVIEGGRPDQMVMWTMIGYPPCSYVLPVTLTDIPEELRPVAPGWRSPMCNSVLQRKYLAFPITRGSGSNYIDMDYLRTVMPEMHRRSLDSYTNFRNK